jgi:hypothetical protein
LYALWAQECGSNLPAGHEEVPRPLD